MNIKDWLEKWETVHAQRVRENTMRGYKAALAHLSPGFLALEINQVTGMDWECEIARVAKDYPRQAQLMHAALRKSWNDGIRYRMISQDNRPYLYVEGPRHRSRRTPYLTPDEMTAYARAAQQTPAALPLMLMLLCGLRRGEALGLCWDDIDRREMIIHVRRQLYQGKLMPLKSTTSYREIPVTEAIIEKIYNWGHIDKTNNNIVSNKNLCYNLGVKCLYKSHASAMAAAGLDTAVTLHGLRHSCATAALDAGADIKTVQGILGHAHFATTADIYCHALTSAERDAIAAVGTRLEIA